ncbi:MAG TPA: SDR family oxidoreductase [Acidimicrobiales bacterium]
MDINGALALVTGTSGGIGAATAETLARHGATVIGVARTADKVEATAERCRTWAPASAGIVGDLSTKEGCAAVVERVLADQARIDIVVNNAGVSLRKHATRTSVGEVEQVTDINYLAAVRLTIPLMAGMVERGAGAIVNITSVAGYVPNPLEAAYGGAKAALSLWSHGLAVDLAGTGVHVGVVNPGPIDTGMWATDEEAPAYHGKLYPPQIVADAVVKAITKEKVMLTVPRQFGLPGMMYPVMGRPMRWGLRTFEKRGEAKGDPREQR